MCVLGGGGGGGGENTQKWSPAGVSGKEFP